MLYHCPNFSHQYQSYPVYSSFNFVEKIVFSGKVIIYNRFGMKQDRTIMLTNLFLSNIKKKGTVINSPKIYLLKFDLYRNSCRVLEEDPCQQNQGCH